MPQSFQFIILMWETIVWWVVLYIFDGTVFLSMYNRSLLDFKDLFKASVLIICSTVGIILFEYTGNHA